MSLSYKILPASDYRFNFDGHFNYLPREGADQELLATDAWFATLGADISTRRVFKVATSARLYMIIYGDPALYRHLLIPEWA